MTCRTWLIRGLILTALAGLAAGVWRAHSYVSPESVRAALISTLGDQLDDVDVHVGSARMRVFGGISVRDLRLTRRGEVEPFFSAPTAIIYHDKEQINRGRLAIRKVELDAPCLRVECSRDGTWSLAGISRAPAADRPFPTFVATRATVSIVDHRANGLPPLVLSDAKLSLLNDPLPVIRAEGHATVVILNPDTREPGPTVRVAASLRVNRVTAQVQIGIELSEVLLGPALASAVERWHPDAARVLSRLTGRAGVRADVAYHPETADPVRYELRMTLKDGRFEDAALPWPVEKIDAVAYARDGRVTIDKATAKAGKATIVASFATRSILPTSPIRDRKGVVSSSSPDLFASFEDALDHATLSVNDLAVDDALFARLPEAGKPYRLRRMFDPNGHVHISYRLTRTTSGGWSREVELRPARLRLVYEKFRYPLDDVTGVVRTTVTHTGTDDTVLDLAGFAAGQRVEVKGKVSGDGPDPAIELKVTGTNVPFDDRLFDAVPSLRARVTLKKLRATARGDFVAEVKQQHGVNRADYAFRIAIYEGTVNLSDFPYPMTNVRGKIAVSVSSTDTSRPAPAIAEADRIVLRDFKGRHGPGALALTGEIEPIPGGRDRKITLRIGGKDCPVDADLRAALAAIRLDAVWRTFSPRGTVTFGVDVEIADREAIVVGDRTVGPVMMRSVSSRTRLVGQDKRPAPPDPPFNPATDLKLAVNFRGPSVTPDFFPYTFDELAGRVRYDGRDVRLEHFTAKHGLSRWSLAAGDVRFYDTGQVWANLGKLEVSPLVADVAFRDALPEKLKSAAEQLNLRGPATATVHHLVVLTPPDLLAKPADPLPLPRVPLVRAQAAVTAPDPDVYWRGEIRLAGAAVDAGLGWDQARGVVACEGRYHGTHLGDVAGVIWLDSASIAHHPVTRVKSAFAARPQDPDPARPGGYLPPAIEFTDLTGTLLRGSIGGHARVVLAEPVRYRVWLTATDVKLEDVARHHNLGNGTKLEGLAQAQLELQTVPDPATGSLVLQGGGAVDVLRGHMLNLPVLLPLLKTLKLQAPDKTAFEEGHATFTVQGDRIRVDHLDLLGTAISLGGSGELDARGERVDFEFYTIWSQTLHRWLTTPLGDVTAFVSEQLFKIEVTRGPDGKLKYDPRVVPFVTTPFRAVAERMKRSKGETYRAAPGK